MRMMFSDRGLHKMFDKNYNDYMPDYLDLLNANRKLGYSTSTAIADICDNPFDAGATKCWVVVTKGSKVVDNIIISDNGKGMSEYELQKALVPASTGRKRNYQGELGYFGVGLVASGLSLGNRIEVFTRGVDGDFYSYLDWDEKCLTNNPVNLVRKCTSDESATVLNPYLHESSTGTVVWISNTKIAHTKYESLLKQLDFHLGTTYYNLRDKYEIYLNNQLVSPWDILESNSCADLSPVHTFKVDRFINGKRIEADITVQLSYIWAENRNRKHPTIMGRTGDNQGGALVRNGRTLTYGTIMNITSKTPLHNALRFRVEYNNSDLDNVIFDINVQKDDCQIVDKDFSEFLSAKVKAYIKEVVRPLNKKYRVSGKADTSKVSGKKLPVAYDRLVFMSRHKIIQKIVKLETEKMKPEQAMFILKELKEMSNEINKKAQEVKSASA
jgi:hypothetical protein